MSSDLDRNVLKCSLGLHEVELRTTESVLSSVIDRQGQRIQNLIGERDRLKDMRTQLLGMCRSLSVCNVLIGLQTMWRSFKTRSRRLRSELPRQQVRAASSTGIASSLQIKGQ